MRKFTLIYSVLITIFLAYLTAQEKVDYKKEAEEIYQKLQKTRSNYIKIFHIDKKFKNRWRFLEERFEKAEFFYRQGDYFTAKTRFENILKDLKYLVDHRNSIKDDVPQTKSKPQKKDPCSEDASLFQAAYLAEHNNNIPRAIELFYPLTKSKCLREDDLQYAISFIGEKRELVLEGLSKLKQAQNQEEKRRLVSSINEIIKGFKKCDPNWAGRFEKLIRMYDYVTKPELRPETKPGIKPDITPGTDSKKETEYLVPETIKAESVGSPYFLAMDVWQSAWMQEFNEKGLRTLFKYLRKNRIRHINLNPGIPMGPKFNEDAYKKLEPIVKAFYASGVEKISFLYAELDYPIEYFAEFLSRHPELGIDTIVDDSEFTDFYKDRFGRNLRAVHRWGIKYSAFATLEVAGNSGVSDETRFWMLRNVDYPILMSYLGCTLESQKKILEKYLQYADSLGKRRTVSIAILLGGKSVGREVSCEKLLSEAALQRFLWDLDAWARRSHPSYRGIVIETNLRQPLYNIHLNHR